MEARKKEISKKVKEWLNFADDDLRVAQHAFTLSSSIPYRLIAFHAQQCAEKSLKAYLIFRDIDFPYTHDISKLIRLCGKVAQWIDKIKNAEELTPFAATARYPGIEKTVTKNASLKAVTPFRCETL